MTFTTVQNATAMDANPIELLDLETRERKAIFRGGAGGRISSSGHLVFRRGNDLLAVPVDPKSLEPRGGPVPVQIGVYAGSNNAGHWDLAVTGTLVYVPSGADATGLRLVWVDAKGSTVPAHPRRAFSTIPGCRPTAASSWAKSLKRTTRSGRSTWCVEARSS